MGRDASRDDVLRQRSLPAGCAWAEVVMRLILLRHGKAEPRDGWPGEDADRPLTRDGERRAQRVLKAVGPLIGTGEIWTSPFLRARATAEIASALWGQPLREQPWLAAEAAPAAAWLPNLAGRGDLVLVGHEPDLSACAALLVGGAALDLKKGGLVVMEGEPRPAGMALHLFLTPRAVLELTGG